MIDTLITGGRIIDGTGNAWFYGDLAISGERIERIAPPGTIDPASAKTVIDATGHVVCPGFIDIQSHSLVPLMLDNRVVSKVTQGVTTEILGEGWTPAPFGGRIDAPFGSALKRNPDLAEKLDAQGRTWTRFGDWLAAIEKHQASVNVGSFVGGSTVREFGMGQSIGEAPADAIEAMREMVAGCMEDGAFGVATAIIYPPNAFSSTEELVQVMDIVARYNGIHITHMRSEGDRILEALDETLEIARRTGVITEIYHLKALGTENWDKMPVVIDRITEARAEGIDIAADMYPYNGGGTGIAVCLPPWAQEDGKLVENVRDPEMRAKILEEMRNPTSDWEDLGRKSGPENVIVTTLREPDNHPMQGMRLAGIADRLGLDWQEAVLHLIATEGCDIFSIFLAMSEDNIRLQAQQPWIKFSTDAGGVDPVEAREQGLTHPRAYGTYTRVIGRYVREFGWLELEDAVRKCSSSVADRLGIRDRGLLRDGMYADIVIFDPATVNDVATYDDPHQLSTGVRDVFVNGGAVVRDGEHTGATPGKMVYGPGKR
ncbi:MAG TPA: D-aminoacylase [Thermomicrobiales bacterium]|nr:D-aminoacylase [Thermomicrobiales bacterium]